MSRGLGWVQRECLRAIAEYEKANGRSPTTYNITAEVYQVERDEDGNVLLVMLNTPLSNVRLRACDARVLSPDSKPSKSFQMEKRFSCMCVPALSMRNDAGFGR